MRALLIISGVKLTNGIKNLEVRKGVSKSIGVAGGSDLLVPTCRKKAENEWLNICLVIRYHYICTIRHNANFSRCKGVSCLMDVKTLKHLRSCMKRVKKLEKVAVACKNRYDWFSILFNYLLA